MISRLILWGLLAGSASAATLPMLNPFRFGSSVSYLSEAYVTNDSVAGFGVTESVSRTLTNWTHVVTNNSAAAFFTVMVSVAAGESPFTNFISSTNAWVTVIPPSGPAIPLPVLSFSNHWGGQEYFAVGIFGAPVGNLLAGNYGVWVTNQMQWLHFVGQSVVNRNVHQSLAYHDFAWGFDSGTPVTSLTLPERAQSDADAAMAWAFHVSSQPWDGAEIPNDWAVNGDVPTRFLVTSNEASFYGNFAYTNLSETEWEFSSGFPSGTASVVGANWTLRHNSFVEPTCQTFASAPTFDGASFISPPYISQKIKGAVGGVTVCEARFFVAASANAHVELWSNADATGTQYGVDSASVNVSGGLAEYVFTWAANPVVPTGTDFYAVCVLSSAGAFQTSTDAYRPGDGYDGYQSGAPLSGPVDLRFSVKTLQ